jgi:hypothetical protein
MADTKRVECPICTKDVPVLKSGVLRNHRNHGDQCPGSGLTPEIAAGRSAAEAPSPADVVEPAPVERGELVQRTELVHDQAIESAIEAAAEAALSMPGVPGRDEFLQLAVTARMLSMSGAAPKLIRGNPHLAFHVALVGRDLGISPSAALELIDVLDTGQGPRLSLSPQLMNGQLRRLGLGSVKPLKRTMHEAIAGAYDPEGVLMGESEFTWEDAVIAGLADKRCKPNVHWVPNSGNGKCDCRQGYRAWPKRMLWWRAAGFCADDYFPEAGLGLYSPEALGAMVDEHGRPVDPATVALPDGYDPGGNGATKGLPPADERADGAELWALQARAFALPDDHKRELRQRREQTPALRTDAGVIPFWQLPDRGLRIAKSLVAGLESRAEREVDGWDRAEALDAVGRHLAGLLVGAMASGFSHPSEAPTGAQSAQEPSQPPRDPEPAAGAPAATQPPETCDEADTVDPELRAKVEAEVTALSVADVETELRDSHGIDPAGLNPPMMRARLVMAELDKRKRLGV